MDTKERRMRLINEALRCGAMATVKRLEAIQYREDSAYIERRTEERWRAAWQTMAEALKNMGHT